MKKDLRDWALVFVLVFFVSSVALIMCNNNPVETESSINAQDGATFIQEGGDGDPPPPPPDPPPPSAPPPPPPDPGKE